MRNAFLVGERLYLRPMEMEDRDHFTQWFNDPEANRFLNRDFPLHAEEEEKWIHELGNRKDQLVLVMVLKDGDRPIGSIGLHGIGLPDRRAELGIAIGEQELWGQGYGREAIGLVLGHAFGRLGLHRVFLHVVAANERGARCYEACGFRKEGELRDARFRDGKFHDIWMYGILEDEVRARS